MSVQRRMLVHQPFFATARRLPDKVALICDGRRHTYAQMAVGIERLAALLTARGVKHGDRIALMLDNSAELVTGMLAASMIGAVFMPIGSLTRQEKLAYLLNDSRASVLISHAALRHIWETAISANGSVHLCLIVEAGDDASQWGPRCLSYPSGPPVHLLDDSPSVAQSSVASVENNDLSESDLASIIYTSGSTGEPKGVMLTHLNMRSALRSVSGYLPVRESEIVMCVLPLAFSYGLYHWLLVAEAGATLILESSFAFPLKIARQMAAERVTFFPGVPTVFTQLLNIKGLDEIDLTSLRTITNAAAPLSREHIRRLRQAFPQAALYSMYGLTECKRVTFLPPDQLDIRPDSVGCGMPYQDHWLADETGTPLPNGGVGELVVRGPHVMRGYWEKPAETAARLRPAPASSPFHGELVLYTGDLFRTDEAGWLYFVARQDDIIKTRGEKVSPREVEDAIYALDGVLEVAVIGIPDELLGAAIKAFVITRPGAVLTEREVIRHCLAHIESYMAPKYVEFVAELPKTESGKIKKTQLR